MQNNKFHYCLHILPILFFMAFVSASCIKDDLSDCPAPRTSGFSLQVKAFDADGGSLGSETIKTSHSIYSMPIRHCSIPATFSCRKSYSWTIPDTTT